ncbi:MAG: hypothetical protein RL385_6011, partial [Pseudomonadota bacterium]
HLTHVINFGFPESAEQYVHRTGRTGRAGRTGTAISVVGPGNLGALYYLRLTFKIFPIERSIPSANEVRTRLEADRVALLAEAFRNAPVDEHLEVVRRLLTRPDAERVLAGLVAGFFDATVGDVGTVAAAARRDHALRAEEAPDTAADSDGSRAASEAETSTTDGGPGRKRRKRRRGRSNSDAPLDLSDDLSDEAEIAPLVDSAERALGDSAEQLALESAPLEIPEAPPELEDMTTLYFNVGRRDGLEATELTDLLNHECALGADDIGRVRVKDRHTFVGVPSERAEHIITTLVGRTVRNRPLHIERART